MRPLSLLSLLCALTVCLASPAYAQYDAEYAQASARKYDTLLRKGRWEGGVNIAGGLSITRTTTVATADRTSSLVLYMNPGLYAGVMVHSRIQLRLTMAYLGIYSASDGATTQNSDAYFGSLQAIYHHPLPLGYAFYAGVGAAAYYGSGRRPLPQSPGTTVLNNLYGGGAQLLAGLLVQPGRHLTMRAGIRFDALFGAERPVDPALGLVAQNTQNYQAMLEVLVGVR